MQIDMRILVVVLLLLINITLLRSQVAKYLGESTYSFFFSEGQISDTSKLELKVNYTNHDKEIVLIHKKLIDAVCPETFIWT